MTDQELRSLVALLDDDDPEVLSHIESKILELGTPVIPFLENEWSVMKDIYHQQKVENIIHQIQYNELYNLFVKWYKDEAHDLLQGVYLIAKYRFPELQKQSIVNAIEKLRLDVWLEMNYDLSAYEKVRIINYIIYKVHGFKGNVENYHDPKNSFINDVLESKKGNPILLAIIYILVAQKLNIPIYGVNLPQHFVLAYLEEFGKSDSKMKYNEIDKLLNRNEKVLFYINAFNQGAIFSKLNLEQFLTQIHIEPKQDFLKPCTNLEIVKRVLRNLASAYEKLGKLQKHKEVQKLLYALGEPPINSFHDVNESEE
ncbi:MAG: transglutaminase-like domain-containing protein [Bacteroidota bacterium]|nr:transglutaminase-like domain-containing protein [Bacteroidota bacterium]